MDQQQSLNISICSVSDELKATLKAFRARKKKNTAALIIQIDQDSMSIVLNEEIEDVTLEEVAADLPTHEPRYVFYSYVHEHADKRVSYPQVLIFVSPEGCKPDMQMKYVGSWSQFKMDSGASKYFTVREPDELTEELLLEKLNV